MGEVVEWRVVAGFDRYEVSNTGLVRNRDTNRVLRSYSNGWGYLNVALHHDGHRKSNQRVHKLVATAFLGDSEGRVVDHIDRNKTNNHVSNLRYVSYSENNRNITSRRGIVYEYVDTLPEEAIELTEYGTHQFESLYYHDGQFYLFTGLEYRILTHLVDARTASIYVQATDTQHRNARINVAKYRRIIGDLP
jgi:hypothetical protein